MFNSFASTSSFLTEKTLRFFLGLGVLAGVGFLTACGSAPPPPSPYRLAANDRAFLPSPTLGYEDGLGTERKQKLNSLHRQLVLGNVAEVRTAADQWHARDPEFAPIAVLRAQVSFMVGDYGQSLERLERIVQVRPDYSAARLLEGRAAEISGDLERAHSAYSVVSLVSSAAGERLEAITPKLAETLIRQIEEALDEADLFRAESLLAGLRQLDEEGIPTLEIRYAVAALTGDTDEELSVLRDLSKQQDLSLSRLIRRGVLELDQGDAMASVSIFQSLLQDDPENTSYQNALARAKFRWRLRVLPAEIQSLTTEPELLRGQYGRMLYWILPGIRTARVESGSIAVDLVAHPHQKELVRVLNVGLLRADPSLRSFFPNKSISRSEVLASLLRYRRSDDGCTREFRLNQRPSYSAICQAAYQCGLLEDVGDCLPGANLSGAEALDFLRLTVSSGSG